MSTAALLQSRTNKVHATVAAQHFLTESKNPSNDPKACQKMANGFVLMAQNSSLNTHGRSASAFGGAAPTANTPPNSPRPDAGVTPTSFKDFGRSPDGPNPSQGLDA